jgi:hypothetical protein
VLMGLPAEIRSLGGIPNYGPRQYPLPETRWVFALLGYEFESISLSISLLMGSNENPTGTWA